MIFQIVMPFSAKINQVLNEYAKMFSLEEVHDLKAAHVVLDMRYPDLVEECLDRGIDVNGPDQAGDTLLHKSVQTGIYSEPENALQLSKLLLINGADVNAKNLRQETPLHRAFEKGSLESIELLGQKGADFECRTEKGQTIMFSAVKNTYFSEPLEVLLQLGYSVNVRDSNKNSLLHQQPINCKNFVNCLIYGFNVDCLNDNGQHPVKMCFCE